MLNMPDDLPVVQRSVVRLVVLDASDRVLFFHTCDPTYPELGVWWELPGGGIEADETQAEAAIRELREETGIFAERHLVGEPRWQRTASFRYRGKRHLQHETVLSVRLRSNSPDVDGSQRVGFEDENYFDFRWWKLAEIVESEQRFYPGTLPSLLPSFLAGEDINEPFELWS